MKTKEEYISNLRKIAKKELEKSLQGNFNVWIYDSKLKEGTQWSKYNKSPMSKTHVKKLVKQLNQKNIRRNFRYDIKMFPAEVELTYYNSSRQQKFTINGNYYKPKNIQINTITQAITYDIIFKPISKGAWSYGIVVGWTSNEGYELIDFETSQTLFRGNPLFLNSKIEKMQLNVVNKKELNKYLK